MTTTSTLRTAAGLLVLATAAPALAAKPAAVKLECSATKLGWAEAREFVVVFERTSNRLRSVAVDERARVFTPTDAAAIYVAQKKGGVITDVPNQRPGKWEGKPNGETEEFALKTKDGSASFTSTPDAIDKTLRALTWKAEMTGADGETLSAQGEGSCRVVSTEVAAPPAPVADAPQAPKAAAPLAAEEPRKEVRLFGGRKSSSTDGGEAVAASPAVKAEAPKAQVAAPLAAKSDEPPASEKPKKEIRLFGRRKGAPPEGEISE